MDKKSGGLLLGTSTLRADGAGGVSLSEEKHWFVAIVNNKSEKKYAELIQRLGYESFVPIQRQKGRKKNGDITETNKILLPATIFVYCTESERLQILKNQFAKRFMVDKTRLSKNGKHPIAVVPDYEIDNFRNFIRLSETPIEILPVPYQIGDAVEIIEGKFKGLQGHVVYSADEKASLIICLGLLGCAKLKIEAKSVAKL